MVHFLNLRDKSSLVQEVYYDDQRMEMTVVLTYDTYVYRDVRLRYFEMFSEVDSPGKYFLTIIKNKLKMAKTQAKAAPLPEPKKTKLDYGCNQSSDRKRYIKQRIKVSDINKEWLFLAEDGHTLYADITLALLPDGTVDRYGNLGMITQDVPKSVSDAEKGFEKKDRTLGPILGNGFEFKPSDYVEQKTTMVGDIENKEAIDDLPF